MFFFPDEWLAGTLAPPAGGLVVEKSGAGEQQDLRGWTESPTRLHHQNTAFLVSLFLFFLDEVINFHHLNKSFIFSHEHPAKLFKWEAALRADGSRRSQHKETLNKFHFGTNQLESSSNVEYLNFCRRFSWNKSCGSKNKMSFPSE